MWQTQTAQNRQQFERLPLSWGQTAQTFTARWRPSISASRVAWACIYDDDCNVTRRPSVYDRASPLRYTVLEGGQPERSQRYNYSPPRCVLSKIPSSTQLSYTQLALLDHLIVAVTQNFTIYDKFLGFSDNDTTRDPPKWAFSRSRGATQAGLTVAWRTSARKHIHTIITSLITY